MAEIVGRQLRAVGERTQVLCVTHLAQVAAQAHTQFRVTKQSVGQITRTAVKTLSETERVDEIARMLGGIDITTKPANMRETCWLDRWRPRTLGGCPCKEKARAGGAKLAPRYFVRFWYGQFALRQCPYKMSA